METIVGLIVGKTKARNESFLNYALLVFVMDGTEEQEAIDCRRLVLGLVGKAVFLSSSTPLPSMLLHNCPPLGV